MCARTHAHTRVCKDTRRGKEQEVPRGHERKEMIDGVAHAIDAVIDLEKKYVYNYKFNQQHSS